MAFFFDMIVTPIERTTVTTAASPSGIAATARDTATMNVSTIVSAFIPVLMSCTPKITTHIPSTSHVRTFES